MIGRYDHSRRRFLYLSGVSLASLLAAGCGMGQPAPTPTPTPQPASPSTTQPTAATQPPVVLGGDAEVWAWQKQVIGQVNENSCPSVSLEVNDQAIVTEVAGENFSATVPLTEGQNMLSARCLPDGAPGEPRAYTARLRNVPFSAITIGVQDDRIGLDGSASQTAPVSATPVTEYRWSARQDNPSQIEILEPAELNGQPLGQDTRATSLVLAAPAVDGEYYISLMVTDETGRSDTSTTYFVVEDGRPRLDDWEWQNTDWVERTVVYGVIPRNFSSQGFSGITERLDDLQDLGINAIWLAPVNISPPGDYGYAVVDYFRLNPRYGSEDDFRQMVKAAHQRGIRVLMDFVPNHTSSQHPYFKHMVEHGTASHYWDFYDHDATGAPTHYFDWVNLPNLSFDNPEVARWMTEAFAYWVREFDVDGFRVDVAWGIRQRNPEYWPQWRMALKRIKPDLLLLAEASARDPYYFTNGFDAAYDWTNQLGHWAWELVFDDENLLTYNLNAALTNVGQGIHDDALVFRFINNNDTGARFITMHGLERTRVFTALLLTLPGIPCVYTGDEVGASFTPYGDANPISWEDRYDLRDYHKTLITLRRQTPALFSRNWQVVEVEPRQQVYGYIRYTSEPEPGAVLVLLNFFDQPAQVQVTLPDGFINLAGQPLRDLLSGQSVSTSGSNPLTLEMGPYSSLLLSPGSEEG